MPKRCGHLSGKSLVEPEVMAAKIRAAVAARRDPDFVIIARTDARGVNGFDDAVRAGEAVPRRRGRRDLPRGAGIGRRVRPVRQGGAGPAAGEHDRVRQEPATSTWRRSGRLGYRLILFPLTAFRVAMKAAEDTLADLFRERAPARLASRRCMTRAELYDLLGYTGYEAAGPGSTSAGQTE